MNHIKCSPFFYFEVVMVCLAGLVKKCVPLMLFCNLFNHLSLLGLGTSCLSAVVAEVTLTSCKQSHL